MTSSKITGHAFTHCDVLSSPPKIVLAFFEDFPSVEKITIETKQGGTVWTRSTSTSPDKTSDEKEEDDSVIEYVWETLRRQLGGLPHNPRLSHELEANLGAGAADIIELLLTLEDELSFEIGDEHPIKLVTVKDFVALVRPHYQAKFGGVPN